MLLALALWFGVGVGSGVVGLVELAEMVDSVAAVGLAEAVVLGSAVERRVVIAASWAGQ